MSDDTTKNPNVNGGVDEDDEEEEEGDFDTGLDRLRGAMAKDKDRFESYKLAGVFRELWLKPGEEAPVRFLTDKPYALGRHSFYYNGRWRRETCRSKKTGGNPKVCPMCADDPKAFPLRDEGAHLLTDRREFSGKNDKVYTNELKVLALAANHIVKIQDDCDESEEKTLKREWKLKRAGEKQKPIYSIYPKPTKPFPDEEKKLYKAILAQFIPEWEEYKKKPGKENLPLERFVVMKALAPMSKEAMQKICDEINAAKTGNAQSKDEDEPTNGTPSGANAGPAAEYSDDDFQF